MGEGEKNGYTDLFFFFFFFVSFFFIHIVVGRFLKFEERRRERPQRGGPREGSCEDAPVFVCVCCVCACELSASLGMPPPPPPSHSIFSFLFPRLFI